MEYFRGEIEAKMTIPVYSGETQENFRRGTVISGKKVYFDKAKLPPGARPNLYIDKTNASFPFHRALVKAIELQHSPLIIEGRISRFSQAARDTNSWVEMPLGYLLPVSHVWVPYDELQWRELDPVRDLHLNPAKVFQRMPITQYVSEGFQALNHHSL